jgi:glycosyltransferase involved in cell wall biosynthesis
VTRRRPRVVLVHYTAPSILGGVEQVMGAHATALREAGADVTIVAGRGRAPKGVRLARIPEVDSRNESVLRDFRSLAQGERTKAHDALVDRLVRKLRPIFVKADRVVVHNVMTMHKDLALTEALVRLARERPGVLIAWTHDLAWSDPQYANERHPGDPWGLIARAHPGIRYVAVSDERADQLASLAGLRREAVAVVPNGVDIAAALGLSTAGVRLAERLDLYRADPLLVLPARLTRRKRIEAAIAATAALRGRGHPAMLVVTGPPGPHNAANAQYLDELKALAEGGVEGVHLLYALGLKAPYRVIADLYALGDALLLPSQSEGFGIPLLEAALHRLPIVCSDLPTLRALAGDAATYVAPDASGEVIADAVERSLGEPGPRFRSRVRAMAWSRVLAELVVPLVLEGIA